MMHTALLTLLAATAAAPPSHGGHRVLLRGEIVDDATGQPTPARLYIQRLDGPADASRWMLAQSADPAGAAAPYQKQRSPVSVEIHTSLSAHPFQAALPPGEYQLTAERGKEYLPAAVTLRLVHDPVRTTIRLRRWSNMAQLGWYSGETHVHRSMSELPVAMLADDLNVAFPLTYWVTQAGLPPSSGDKNSPADALKLVTVDPTHVIYPLNTEYELTKVGSKRHTLGAVFAINHKSVLTRGAPPVRPIARQVHKEGGLLELDKHNWPWSMMLVPVMKVDLYELTNNHLWRTKFHFRRFGEPPPPYMNIEQDEDGLTEKGWIDFTLQNYYALLNCGFRLRPTAGTASGVHPVPLGFGRVYVHLPDGFSYDGWLRGLNQGRSFVTTGPLLEVRLNDALPDRVFRQSGNAATRYHLTGWARSPRPLGRIEIVAAGRVERALAAKNRPLPHGGYESAIEETLEIDASTWLAVRCFQPAGEGRVRFAHTAPFHIDVAGAPLRPRRAEVEYLAGRMAAEIERNRGVLDEASLQEYRDALAAYQEIAEQAR